MQQRVHLLIKGVVQGVGFRYHTQKQAQEAGLVGWVMNTQEGHVECFVEGEEEKVGSFLKWCWTGVPTSKVTAVEILDEESLITPQFSKFEIRR